MRDETAKKLLQKVKDDYSKIALPFDMTRKEAWNEFELFLPFLKENQKLLDIGCGNGRLYEFLKNKNLNIDYTGIDNNEKLIEIAKRNHPEAGFRLADALSLPFDDGNFDHIWNIASFHHIPSKKFRLKSLNEMNRVLKQDGRLIMTVWNLWQKKYRHFVLKTICKNVFSPYDLFDAFIPFQNIERYYHAFLPFELRKLLEKTGFKITDEFYTKKGEKVLFLDSYNICFICRK